MRRRLMIIVLALLAIAIAAALGATHGVQFSSLSKIWGLRTLLIDPLAPLSIIYDKGAFAGWPIVGFLVIGTLLYVFTSARGEAFSLRGLVRFIFPQQVYRGHSFRIDCWSYLINAYLEPALSVLTFGITGESVCRLLLHLFGQPVVMLPRGWLANTLAFGVIFLVGDFAAYLAHYLLHRPFMWPIHSTHHSAESLNPLTAYRKNPLEIAFFTPIIGVISGTGTGVMLYFMGEAHLAPAIVSLFAVISLIGLTLQYLYHSSMWITFGPLDALFLSPAMHQVHHSAAVKHRDKNFGGMLIIWDRLFRTAYIPKNYESFSFGISECEKGENNPHKTLKGFLITPLVAIAEMIRAYPKKNTQSP